MATTHIIPLPNGKRIKVFTTADTDKMELVEDL